MKSIKIDLAAALKLKKTVDDEAENLSEEQELLIDGIFELDELLKDIEFARTVGLDMRAKEFEENLKNFEGLIGKKYWNEQALFCIRLLILSNSAQTVEEAVSMYEEYKKL